MSSFTSWDVPQEAFNYMLAWLGPDPDQAGKKYEEIRRSLIRIFTCRGCTCPEDLADETINRVARKVYEDDIAPRYVGEPALYFYGFAQKVYQEWVRKKADPVPPPAVEPSPGKEEIYECLENCMEQRPAKHRDLILKYFQEEKQAKIDHRKELAEELGISVNALRIKVYRITSSLRECVVECLKQGAARK